MFTIEINDEVLANLEEMFLLEGESFTAGIPTDCNFIKRIKNNSGDTTEDTTTREDHGDPWNELHNI